jgi:hypothetical protein
MEDHVFYPMVEETMARKRNGVFWRSFRRKKRRAEKKLSRTATSWRSTRDLF